MDTETIEWQGWRLLTRERWGSIHPQKPWNWYDPSAISITPKNELSLGIHFNPREFFLDGKTVLSQWGIGLVCFEKDFSFGRFKIIAKLPKGAGLWPAFWMYPPVAWPPEIDVFEAYSKNHNYWGGLFHPWNIETCVHRENGIGLKRIPARAPWWYDFDHDFNPLGFNSYWVNWTPESLVFGINANVVRRITDPGHMASLANYRMMVILNTHIDGRYKDSFSYDPSRPFLIQSFQYDPYTA